MRKFVKTAAVLALAFALLSTSAFAATTLTGSVVPGSVDGTYTANISGANGNEQITILGVEADVDVNAPVVPALTDSNILYINQMAATSGAGAFENFSLKGASNGRTIHFFAGSATSDEAKYLGAVTEAINYTVEVQSGVSVEVNKSTPITVEITPVGYTDNVAWTVVSSNAALATLTDGSKDGVTFSATTEGTYTVRATLVDGKYGEADVTVTPKNVTVTGFTPKIVTVTADGEDIENQNAVGVALTFENLGEFTHMIWGFGDGTGNTDNRKYSTAIPTNGLSGNCTFAAAFGNGTVSGTAAGADGKITFDVQDVSALFWDGTDTYFTHPDLDKNNKAN